MPGGAFGWEQHYRSSLREEVCEYEDVSVAVIRARATRSE